MFLVGVAIAALLETPWWLTAAVAALLPLAADARLLRGRARPALLVCAAIAVTLGHARFEASVDAAPPPLAAIRGEHEVVGTIREDPRLRGLYARVDLAVASVDGAPVTGGLRVTLPTPFDPLAAGDRLRLVVDLEDPPAIDAFDYPAFLASRGIYAVAAFPDFWTVEGHDSEGPRSAGCAAG